MDSVSFDATTQLENKLSGIYEILYKKESKIATKIKHYKPNKKSNNIDKALAIHLLANGIVIIGLFGLLY